MFPLQPKEFLLFYAALTALALLLFFRNRPRRGMLLRLRGWGKTRQATGRNYSAIAAELKGKAQATPNHHNVTPIHGPQERPLNVVFNYNGHSWDAYEVLGLPAGSSLDTVEAAFAEAMNRVDDRSKPFLEAAYQAIQEQWKSFGVWAPD